MLSISKKAKTSYSALPKPTTCGSKSLQGW